MSETMPGGAPHATALLVRLEERPYAEVDLYCFPHGGGGPTAFRSWGAHLPQFIDAHLLALPGREHRVNEPPASDVEAVIAELVEALRHAPRPYALFGHSSGSVLATHVALALERSGAPAPVLLGVSAFPAPHLSARRALIQEMFRSDLEGTVARLDPQAATLFGDPDTKAAVLGAVSADISLYSGYRTRIEEPLACPISTFCGEDDPVVTPAELAEWSALTQLALTPRRYPGGHFYLREQRAAVVADLTWDLAAALPAASH